MKNIHATDPTRSSSDILEAANYKTKAVLVVGYDANGDIYCDTNVLDGGDMLWLLEQVKHKMLTLNPAHFVQP